MSKRFSRRPRPCTPTAASLEVLEDRQLLSVGPFIHKVLPAPPAPAPAVVVRAELPVVTASASAGVGSAAGSSADSNNAGLQVNLGADAGPGHGRVVKLDLANTANPGGGSGIQAALRTDIGLDRKSVV